MLGIVSKFVASSGAAAILGNGQTIHNLLRIPISLKKNLTPSWHIAVNKRLGNTKLLILDEISLVSPRLLEALDFRMRAIKHNNLDFGGLHVIVLGDMFQLKVVSDLPFYEGAVNHTASNVVSLSRALAPRLDEDRGIELFCSLQRVELSTQHRCKDGAHKALIQAIRDPDVLCPLTTEVIDQIGELTAADAEKECWRRAVYVCQTNAERRMYNEFGVKRFAAQTNQPVLYWVCPQGGSRRNMDSQERMQGGQNLYGLGYETHCYFVRGMPVQITENISVRDGIANGADAVLVSVTPRSTNSVSGEKMSLPPVHTMIAGQELQMALPHSVNVVLQKHWDKAVQQHRSDHGLAVDAEVDVCKVKVPEKWLVALPCHAVYPATGTRHQKFRWIGHSYTPGFCLTYWKIQGRTVTRHLIVAADKTRSGSGLTLAQVYVAISRVTSLGHVKFMPMQPGRAQELSQLSYPHTLKMWARNYTKGLVKLVVDGRIDAESGTVVVVRFRDEAPRRLEIFSSRVEASTTVLTLCSGVALKGVDGVVHLGRTFQVHDPIVSSEIAGSGKWTVKLVVDGFVNALPGAAVVVRFRSETPGRRLEVFSSNVLADTAVLTDTAKYTTVLNLCSDVELKGADARKGFSGAVYQKETFQSHIPDVPLEIDGIGKWKTGGLRTEFHAAELAVMDTLAQYKRFETGKVPQAVLRTLCSRLSIRYCAEDRVKVLVQRLTPTWIKARARKKMMAVRWTKEAVKKMVPDADLIRHIRRHEWCPVCKGPSYNNFLQKVVGKHRRLSCAQTNRFSRRCGDVLVLAGEQYNITSAVANKMKLWNAGSATEENDATTTATADVEDASPELVVHHCQRGESATGSGAQVATPSTTLPKRKCVGERAENRGVAKRRKGGASVHRALFEKPAQRDREMVRVGIYTLDQRARKIETWLNKKRARNEVVVRRIPKKAKTTGVKVKETEPRVAQVPRRTSKRRRNEDLK